MAKPLVLHEDRLFPSEASQRSIARALFAEVRGLPIISPHGHTDPRWFAENEPFSDATSLLLTPDHYLLRMLYSQGVGLDALGVQPRPNAKNGGGKPADPRAAWRIFASNWRLFRGTPSWLWLNQVFVELFGLDVELAADTADLYFDRIGAKLATDEFRPRALFDRFKIELLATTESAIDPLDHHKAIRASGWSGRVVTTYRPDTVIDPEHEAFRESFARLGEMTGEDVRTWRGYLAAHRARRAAFIAAGATASDHGHPTAATADLDPAEAEKLFGRIVSDSFSAEDAELFRAQMLTEMARMSLEDGLVLQIHPGTYRSHNPLLFGAYGRDIGADIPTRTDYVRALKPLLDRFGNEKSLTVIVFTLDETTYSRELAPLAGHYPALRLGPPWWFFDAPEGMLRFREAVTETAGFYNTVGFNDDTRAFLSIPARHDVARRVDCAYLAKLVAEHRMTIDEAHEVAFELSYNLAKQAYRVGGNDRQARSA
ncbi:glucuronate isomerase [Roseiterribacter gracilis]|uniref:Uronate isomerase n=1 Tax=Roseiterribacter gracilis TaxID=2812848 RepID=A0A8S8XAI7_9PROT|nr:uronate isomerase [Rhodospirillales bacterium TMPK1]